LVILIRIHCRKANSVADHINDTLKILKHVNVPESQNTKSPSLQLGRPSCVSNLIIKKVVLPAIQLNDQPPRVASEVGDVVADRHLPPKMIALAPQYAEFMP
jgi:hypothetical protein